jgi:hypothetical protein
MAAARPTGFTSRTSLLTVFVIYLYLASVETYAARQSRERERATY